LHINNCIHGDLKPAYVFLFNFLDSRILGKILLFSNILIKDNILKICDFGISKIIATISKITNGVGTPAYMSPELYEDQEYGFKADVW
jgi:serine/threonine protein kinase